MTGCPFCDSATREVSGLKFFRQCPKHKILVNSRYKVLSYEEDYFGAEYKAQYGKEYLADKDALWQRNARRFDLASACFSAQSHKRVLEVGSAAGFFLELMQQKGFETTGIEISRQMSDYANKRGITTIHGSFTQVLADYPDLPRTPFDVVAAFYVLEHFPDQKSIWQNFSQLTRSGGFLLLALPSYAGPAFLFNKAHWGQTHPADHAVDYSPLALKRVSAEFDFRVRKTTSEGIHPQRFPMGKYFPLRQCYTWLQKITAFSDTIFAILEKA